MDHVHSPHVKNVLLKGPWGLRRGSSRQGSQGRQAGCYYSLAFCSACILVPTARSIPLRLVTLTARTPLRRMQSRVTWKVQVHPGEGRLAQSTYTELCRCPMQIETLLPKPGGVKNYSHAKPITAHSHPPLVIAYLVKLGTKVIQKQSSPEHQAHFPPSLSVLSLLAQSKYNSSASPAPYP